MYNKTISTEQVLILTTGKLAGFLLAIATPVFLSRWLSIDEYGTYKQIILIWMIASQILNSGMDLGLFYFVKKCSDHASIYSQNVTTFNFTISVLAILTLNSFPGLLSNLLNNPLIEKYVPYLSLLLIFSIPTQHFEHYLLTLGKIKLTLILELSFELAKSFSILLGFFLFNSLELVLILLSSICFIKFIILLSYNIKLQGGRNFRFDIRISAMIAQLKYCLPLGVARIITAIIYFDRILISSMFTLKEFTIYSVGCFEIPFVNTVINTIWDVSSLEMISERVRDQKVNSMGLIWRDTYRKISLISIPVVTFSLIFAHEIITIIFSDQYLSSVPYFRLFLISFLIHSFDCELIYRVFGKNSVYLKFQIINAIVLFTLVVSLGHLYGPIYALIGKVIANFCNMLLLHTSAKWILLVSWEDYFPWRDMLAITLFSIASSVTLYILFNLVTVDATLKLPIFLMTYILSSALIYLRSEIISKSEADLLRNRISSILGKTRKVLYRNP